MATAFLAAKRSKDPCSQVGACIVNEDKKIVGVGYNGMPIGCSDDQFPWNKEQKSKLDTKYLYGNYEVLSALRIIFNQSKLIQWGVYLKSSGMDCDVRIFKIFRKFSHLSKE